MSKAYRIGLSDKLFVGMKESDITNTLRRMVEAGYYGEGAKIKRWNEESNQWELYNPETEEWIATGKNGMGYFTYTKAVNLEKDQPVLCITVGDMEGANDVKQYYYNTDRQRGESIEFVLTKDKATGTINSFATDPVDKSSLSQSETNKIDSFEAKAKSAFETIAQFKKLEQNKPKNFRVIGKDHTETPMQSIDHITFEVKASDLFDALKEFM
jgi:hypothetical protein